VRDLGSPTEEKLRLVLVAKSIGEIRSVPYAKHQKDGNNSFGKPRMESLVLAATLDACTKLCEELVVVMRPIPSDYFTNGPTFDALVRQGS
jgi:hypothetical protein